MKHVALVQVKYTAIHNVEFLKEIIVINFISLILMKARVLYLKI